MRTFLLSLVIVLSVGACQQPVPFLEPSQEQPVVPTVVKPAPDAPNAQFIPTTKAPTPYGCKEARKRDPKADC